MYLHFSSNDNAAAVGFRVAFSCAGTLIEYWKPADVATTLNVGTVSTPVLKHRFSTGCLTEWRVVFSAVLCRCCYVVCQRTSDRSWAERERTARLDPRGNGQPGSLKVAEAARQLSHRNDAHWARQTAPAARASAVAQPTRNAGPQQSLRNSWRPDVPADAGHGHERREGRPD